MSTIDREWNDLMADWQAEEPVAAPLSDEARQRIRRRVRLYGYRMVLITLFELAGCAAMLAWVWKGSMDEPRAIGTVGVAGTAVIIAVALGFSLWNRRGVWAPATESTLTFVELSLERQRRNLMALRFGPWFLAGELAFLIPWSVWSLLSKPAEPWRWLFAFGWMGGMSILFLVFWAWYRKRTLRKLAEWEELRQALDVE